MLDGYDNASDIESSGGYIRVIEDVRGKYGSGGDYVMNRPWHGPLNPHGHRPFDGHLGHHRVAGAQHPAEQRARGHARHLL